MRILIDINHPKDANVFKNVINKLSAKGHTIKLVAADKENVIDILDSFGFEFSIKPHYKGLVNKIVGMLKNDYRIYKIGKEFKPDLFTSFGSPFAAQASKLLRKKHISFSDTDSEIATINQFIITTLMFSEIDYVPSCHRTAKNKKQVRYNGYFELAYLHPNHFQPDSKVIDQAGLSVGEKYVVLRFSSLNAHHDIGAEGFNFTDNADILSFVERLSQYGKVFLTTEVDLSPELEKYRINVPAQDFHSFLYYSSLYMGEGASMAAEAAILGVPSIYVSNTTRGYLEELELKYGLAFTIKNRGDAFNKAIEILNSDNKQMWSEKRMRMTADKIDVAQFMVEAIEKEL